MEAYFDVLRTVTSRENDPRDDEPPGLATAGGVRRFVHAHVRRHLRALRAAYTARLTCSPAGPEREWLDSARTDLRELADELRPWEFALGRRSTAALAVFASVAGILRTVHVDSDVLLDIGAGLFLGLAGALAFYPLAGLLLLLQSFNAARALLREADVYSREDRVYDVIGLRKEPEPLTDFTISQMLALVVGAYVGAVLALFDAPSVGGGWSIGIGAGLAAMFVLIVFEHRAKKRRTPR
jgi:hypothetical protein